MKRLPLIGLIVLAILVDGFFALINFFPEAPQPSRGPHRRVLLSLDASQAKWLHDNLLDEFNQEFNVDVDIVTAPEEQILDELKKAPNDVILAAIPRARGDEAVSAKSIRSFEDVVPRAQLDDDFQPAVPRLLKAAQVGDKQVFLPRLAMLDIVVFRISRVRDAVRHWALLKPQIDRALKAKNGRGLPEGYQLELEPSLWDSYDRFVIGYFWAHRKYGGEHARGRIAHRTGEQLDGLVEITQGLYRAGATEKTLADFQNASVRDYFTWEELYKANGLYHASMFGDQPLDEDGEEEGLRKGEIFLANLDQIEAFTLHGGSRPGSPPGVEDPDDLGFAPLPRISSLALDAQGKPVRAGRSFAFREDWVWTVPARSADPQLAYQLVRFLWERDIQYRECEALGTLPMRTDLQRERSSLFRLVWMDDIFDAVFEQWEKAEPLPSAVEAQLGSRYAQIWERAIKRGEPLEAFLRAPPAARPAPPFKPVATAEPAKAASAESDDEDKLEGIDTELWHGRVELEGVDKR